MLENQQTAKFTKPKISVTASRYGFAEIISDDTFLTDASFTVRHSLTKGESKMDLTRPTIKLSDLESMLTELRKKYGECSVFLGHGKEWTNCAGAFYIETHEGTRVIFLVDGDAALDALEGEAKKAANEFIQRIKNGI